MGLGARRACFEFELEHARLMGSRFFFFVCVFLGEVVARRIRAKRIAFPKRPPGGGPLRFLACFGCSFSRKLKEDAILDSPPVTLV